MKYYQLITAIYLNFNTVAKFQSNILCQKNWAYWDLRMRWKQTSAELRNSCAVVCTGVWYKFWKYFFEQMAKRLFEGVQVSKWIIDYNQVKSLCNTILFWNSIRSITHSTVRNLPNPWLKKLFRKCLTRYVIYKWWFMYTVHSFSSYR